MSRRKIWLCDFEGCSETAEYYRRVKGKPVKLCRHHEIHMHKERMGYPLDFQQLSRREIQLLEQKEEKLVFECPNCKDIFVLLAEEVADSLGAPKCPMCNIPMQQI